MMYQTKEGSKAYNHIKSVCEAEEKEYKAYIKRVEEAVNFEFEKYQGYQPNRSLLREYEITAIWVTPDKWGKLDKKIWKKIDEALLKEGSFIAISPIKRTKQGKHIASVLKSYNAVTNHFELFKDLGVNEQWSDRVTITQLFSHGKYCFVYFDDSIRADKDNSDLIEITIGEYERLINEES